MSANSKTKHSLKNEVVWKHTSARIRVMLVRRPGGLRVVLNKWWRLIGYGHWSRRSFLTAASRKELATLLIEQINPNQWINPTNNTRTPWTVQTRHFYGEVGIVTWDRCKVHALPSGSNIWKTGDHLMRLKTKIKVAHFCNPDCTYSQI